MELPSGRQNTWQATGRWALAQPRFRRWAISAQLAPASTASQPACIMPRSY